MIAVTKAQPTDACAKLHHACTALGTRLFTVSTGDMAAGLPRRAFTSHPTESTLGRTKPMPKYGWYNHCIVARQVFIANRSPEFSLHFFDHALITSMGLDSCINIPVFDGQGSVLGPVLGTINLLAEVPHFTPKRVAANQRHVHQHHAAMCKAMVAQ